MRKAYFDSGHPVLRGRVLAAALLSSLATLPACNVFGLDTQSFIVPVDSIRVPEAIGAEDTLTARFFGRLGPDLCSRLERVEQRREPGLLEIRFHGERREDGDCPQMPAALDHAETVLPPFEDPFTIRVLQPDAPPLERVVRIR